MNTRNQIRTAGRLLAMWSIAALSACNGGSSSQAGPQSITGWWRNQAGGCICPAEPECRGGDCVAYNVINFAANGTYYGGSVAVSTSTATMSTVGKLDTGTYTIEGSTVRIRRPPTADYTPTFSSDRGHLTLAEQELVPVEDPLARALTKATANGQLTWSSYPMN